jgi:hypothetical protein
MDAMAFMKRIPHEVKRVRHKASGQTRTGKGARRAVFSLSGL